VLTIDRSIQFATEEALIQRVNEVGAKSGYVIVMDAATGEVYAMASVRRDDDRSGRDHIGQLRRGERLRAGLGRQGHHDRRSLNQGSVRPDTTFVVPWRRQYADDLLSDSHQHPDELMTVEQILVESSNIGTIDIQESMGFGNWDTARQSHWEYMRSFGFGERTALNFPGESPGILKHWTDLWGSERVTVAYGQGFAAPRSRWLPRSTRSPTTGSTSPRAGQGLRRRGRDLVPVTMRPAARGGPRRRRDPGPADDAQVVCRGTGKRPTGSRTSRRRQDRHRPQGAANGDLLHRRQRQPRYYASFAGFFPAEDPQITVLVSIDEPPAGDINRFGGTAAAPVFAGLVPEIAHELSIQPPADTTPCPGDGHGRRVRTFGHHRHRHRRARRSSARRPVRRPLVGARRTASASST
jgi:cell division protein FtsI (penicillin-binding protein 3)